MTVNGRTIWILKSVNPSIMHPIMIREAAVRNYHDFGFLSDISDDEEKDNIHSSPSTSPPIAGFILSSTEPRSSSLLGGRSAVPPTSSLDLRSLGKKVPKQLVLQPSSYGLRIL